MESRPGSLTGLTDDALGELAVSLAIAEVRWSPDVAPAVLDRISRDAVAYPEHFDRRPVPGRMGRALVRRERSTGSMLTRLVIFALIIVVVVVLVLLAATASSARAASTDLDGLAIDLEPVAQGFDEPVFVTSAGDGSGDLYVLEQSGRIRVLRADGSVDPDPVLDLSGAVVAGGEQGLLGLAFHPDYPEDGRLFVDYTRLQDGATVVSEFRVRDGVADPDSERELLVIGQPYGNHNGGMVAFDASGYLLIGMGDGGGGGDPLGAGQDPGILLGKLLRIDVDDGDPYAIPPDNGYAHSEAHRPEIHAMGLRNPWRFSVDPEGGHVYIGDVGQTSWEEVSVLPGGVGGLDFGWNEVEGPQCYRDGCDPGAHTAPALFYGHDAGCSIIGGNIYRGSSQPALEGVYVFGDHCSGTIWGASAEEMLSGPTDARVLGHLDGTLVSFGLDEAGEIHAVDRGGRILHVVATEAS